MKIIHSVNDPCLTTLDPIWKSVFLAGPTPRDPSVQGWRPEAIRLFGSMGYTGWLFVPEPAAGLDAWKWDHRTQLEWESRYLEQAGVVLFWIPRSRDEMPGLTTNVEFGMWISRDPRKVVLGAPPDAWRMESLEYYGRIHGVKRHSTLPDTVAAAMALLGRRGEESR